MHELSIASDIIEIAEKSAREHHAACISKIEIVVGRLSGVVHDSLMFAMEEAVKGSMLEKAEVVIIDREAKARCNQCMHEFDTDSFYNTCPACGGFSFELIAGSELKISSIIIG